MTNDPFEELRHALPERFTIEDWIDEGGQGFVFRGKAGGVDAAIKLFIPAHDPEFKRLQREIPFLASCDDPHLVKILDHDEIEFRGQKTRIVAYEYLPGGNLTQFLEPSATLLSPTELTVLGEQIGSAVQLLWTRPKRIVHRDIKPANIVRREATTNVLVDVGYARHIDRSGVTVPGHVPGTAGFKSPEQALGRKNLTVHSDIFSLGVTLYLLACKTHPFEGSQQNIGDVSFSVVPLRERREDIPDDFARLIHRMMSHRASARPNRVDILFRAMREAEEGEEI